jgi:hypothetical protein
MVLCLLGGLCTELSSFKVKATLANQNITASASSLSKISSISHCLCYLYLYEHPLFFLAAIFLRLPRATSIKHGGLSSPSLGAPPTFLQQAMLT